MRSIRLTTIVAGTTLALATAGAQAQTGPGAARRPAMAWGPAAAGDMAGTVIAVVTNETVAKAIGLTDGQREALREKLNADKVRTALAAATLAEAVAVVLADPVIAAELELTAAQTNAARQTITPALIRQVLSPREIERAARSLTIGAWTGGEMTRALQERFREFDRDGDGRLSEEEIQAARETWRRRAAAGRGRGEPRGERPENE